MSTPRTSMEHTMKPLMIIMLVFIDIVQSLLIASGHTDVADWSILAMSLISLGITAFDRS